MSAPLFTPLSDPLPDTLPVQMSALWTSLSLNQSAIDLKDVPPLQPTPLHPVNAVCVFAVAIALAYFFIECAIRLEVQF